jgi:hypothetical protein
VNDQSLLDGSTQEWNKLGAVEEIENLKSIRATAWDEHTHSFRWLMATLLAINGGACLAVLNQDQMDLEHKLAAAGLFILGLLMALLVAVFGQHSVQKTLGPLQKQIGYWMTVVDDGDRDEAIENELNAELKASARIGFAARVSGWLAAMAFIVGVVVAGYGLILTKNNNVVETQTTKSVTKAK